MNEIASNHSCKLCGLPTAASQTHENGFSFCCFGCREVYRCFGEAPPLEPARSITTQQPDPEGSEAFLRIDGMHCASCEILIHKNALQNPGILAVKSSYATSTAKVIYDPNLVSEEQLPALLSRSGYQAHFSDDYTPEKEDNRSLLRLIVAEAMLTTVMMLYVAFYYPTHLGLVEAGDLEPVHWLAYTAVPMALLVFSSVMIFYVGYPLFRGAFIGLRTGVLNMDNLLLIAILAAYAYSIGQMMIGSIELYFDVAVTIVAVVTIGRYLEKQARLKATKELSDIMHSWAPIARVLRQGEQLMLTLKQLKPSDRILVQQGEAIPVDGTIRQGEGAIDESLMTGEPFPITRSHGEHVLGGSILVEGEIEFEVGHAVESQMDNLARILWNAQSSTLGTQNLADYIARLFVPAVLILATVVSLGLFLTGSTASTALLAGMATLIVSCPCTFGLAIPLTTAVGISTALRKGIIITHTNIFEKIRHIDTVAIDKTGTLSSAEMSATRVAGNEQVSQFAAAVERLSVHPIAEAIAQLDTQYTATDAKIFPGKGVSAVVEGIPVAVGSRSLFIDLGWLNIDEDTSQFNKNLPEDAVLSYVGWSRKIQGAIVTQDCSRPEWQLVVDKLRQQSQVILLTGAERSSGYQEHVDEAFCGIPPEGKAAVIEHLKTKGTVAMIGDGSNDAPALAAADLGIAFGAPTSLAADAADIVIPGKQLDSVFVAFELIHTIRNRVRQNLAWAFLYNAAAIPLAISGSLNPLFAAVAMSASSLLVVWNSSRSM